jgi:hypothetical protein
MNTIRQSHTNDFRSIGHSIGRVIRRKVDWTTPTNQVTLSRDPTLSGPTAGSSVRSTYLLHTALI